MKTVKVCKYNYNDPSYEKDWMSIDEYFENHSAFQVEEEIWKGYLAVELGFIDCFVRIMTHYADEEFKLTRFSTYTDDLDDEFEGILEKS